MSEGVDGHGAAHEQVLERLVAGDVDPRAPEVVRLRMQCAACAERIAALSSLANELDAEGALMRDALAAAQGESGPRDEVEAALARVRATETHRSPRLAVAQRRSAWLAAAALVVAGLGVAWWLGAFDDRAGSPTSPPVILGTDRIRDLAPAGDRASFAEFRWTAAADLGGSSFELVIDDATSAREVLRREVDEPRFTPTADESRALPDRIRWRVRAIDPSGGRTSFVEAAATRAR